jgi:hypothetical protein
MRFEGFLNSSMSLNSAKYRTDACPEGAFAYSMIFVTIKAI